MNSKVIDTIEVKEQYTTTNGSKKTRIHTIRAMVNNGSEFINYKCGRNSVNISKNIVNDIAEKLTKLNWDNTATADNTAPDNNQSDVVKALAQLQKQINQLKGGK